MLTFPGDQGEATNTTSITFNVTELGVDSGSSPKYQFGDYCLEEKEELVDSVAVFFWQVTECETGKLIIWFEGSTIPQCMEDVLVGDWAAEGNATILLKPTVFCDGVAIVDGASEAEPEASGTTIEDVNTTVEPKDEATEAASDAATDESTAAPTDESTAAATEESTAAPTDAPTEASTTKPCEPCRNVEEGRLAGFYQLQSSTDRRCDNGCSYTNWYGAEFCFEEGGFKTSLECQDESLEVNL